MLMGKVVWANRKTAKKVKGRELKVASKQEERSKRRKDQWKMRKKLEKG